MKTTKQIITTLENAFFCHHKNFENYRELSEDIAKEDGTRTLSYEYYHKLEVTHSAIALFIAQLLADIKEIDEFEEEQQLIKKFNLRTK